MASPNESSSSSPLEMGIEKFTDKNFEEKELSSQSLGLNGDEFLVEYDANDTSDPQVSYIFFRVFYIHWPDLYIDLVQSL